MNVVVVHMSGMAVSGRAGDVLTTYSLGSCLGVAMYDPLARVGGMIHCMLPESAIHPGKAAQNPCMFVDTGIPALLRELLNAGCRTERLIVKAAGASCMIPDDNAFMIGKRNHEACLKVLAAHGLESAACSIGGNSSRSLSLDAASGRFAVRQYGRETEL